MTMIDRWLTRILDRLFEKRCIQHDGTTVLYRWYVKRMSRGGAVYIHHFVRSDGREMHDHPKAFITIGLKGGYREASAEPGDLSRISHTLYRAPWIRRFPPHYIHRVMLEDDETCWTIALVGARTRPWGFFVPKSCRRWLDHPWGDTAHQHRWVNWQDFHGLRTAEDRARDPETRNAYLLPDGSAPENASGASRSTEHRDGGY